MENVATEEFISRTEALKDFESCNAENPNWTPPRVKTLLLRQPAADVAPVVHGRWAHLGGDEWCCSACGFVITTEGSWDKPTKKYCEDCGARMDGDDDAKAD